MLNTKKVITTLVLFLFITSLSQAQKHLPRFEEIDVQHYIFELNLNDKNDGIKGEAHITVQFLKPISSFYLDLTTQDDGTPKKGMRVSQVLEGDKTLAFEHIGDRLIINMAQPMKINDIKTYQISYAGIPADGLIISKNKYGDRTFFGDNWPNRAHHWLPTVDHPSDKATVEFIVNAPEYYQVVANGRQYEESNLNLGWKRTHWKEAVPLPTKVMVIGVARFAVELSGFSGTTPVSSWIYPQDRTEGFGDYAVAVKVLDYFTQKIGKYPYEKLANVQSKTRYGGMENAGNIFYFEGSVTGKKDHEDLIAHEIVHQWFGNSASELNWHHIWLSEGFATYLTDMYIEDTQGKAAFQQRMKEERQQAISYNQRNAVPIVNTKITDYNQLLNPNSYQKAGWVLHMLRHKIGTDTFWKGIQKYYDRYQFSNALTKDFQAVIEEVSGQDLTAFFQQWIFRPGHPILKVDWKQSSKGNINIAIEQVQNGEAFTFPLEITLEMKDGSTKTEKLEITKKTATFKLNTNEKVQKITLDKTCVLFFEEK